MFNLQSGIHRQRFPGPLRSSKSKGTQMQTGAASSVHSYAPNGIQINTKEKHTKAVTGLAVDSLNRNLVSCGLDGKVKVQLLAFNREIHAKFVCSSGILFLDGWSVN